MKILAIALLVMPSLVRFSVDGKWERTWDYKAGDAFRIRVGLDDPSALPANGRIEVSWRGPDADAGWTKALHALDPDVYLVYRAPKTGRYTLAVESSTRAPVEVSYVRDTGLAPRATPPPSVPVVRGAAVTVDIQPVDELHRGDILLEAEPNNTPAQANEIPFAAGDADQTIRVIGGSDELEYFNNPDSGRSPDDWYRVQYRGTRPKILTANLQLAEPVISARIRVYQPGHPKPEDLAPRELPNRSQFGNANPIPYVHPPAEVIEGPPALYSYYEGRDLNERIHQQDDNFRSFVTRKMEPGGVYYLRVESNQPGYELELRLVDGAPFEDPRRAVRQAIYYHLAEVDAWLIHRPRNIAQHQRVRDGGNLLGESCMSCHTQSGVWGVADAFRNGYRPEGTAQNFRRLVNTMYESLRPTNHLVDAATNTSLAPIDLGDAPAGSRVAGRNIVLHERTFRPKRLHSYQQRRTANYVLQTADPGGINAAGKGSNFGPNVVFNFAAEILERAWRDTGETKYFEGLEDKARKIVATGDRQLKVSDDLGHRIEFFYRLWPKDYLQIVERVSKGDTTRMEAARKFDAEFRAQVEKDMRRLLALQQKSGGWGFELAEGIEDPADPAPTAVALMALHAAGRTAEDPVVRRATEYLLKEQYPYGLWNIAAQTGFVTTAYTIRALSQIYPADAKPFNPDEYAPRAREAALETLSRARRTQAAGEAKLAGRLIELARNPMPEIRYQGLLGIGGALAEEGVAALIGGLGDPVKMCREAAFWSLRQLLLDDRGWKEMFSAWKTGSARTRQSIAQALVTRVDLVGPRSQADLDQLRRLLREAMADPHPGVRGWAFKAAWHWWVWNPPLREAISRAWVDALERPEADANVEVALRYSTASLLMVNGHIANQTGGDNQNHQYQELAALYRMLDERRQAAAPEARARLDRRLTAVAATHFQERGSDGGPGQLGYSTPGAAALMGKAVMETYQGGEESRIPWRKIAMEGAANIAWAPLQQQMLAVLRGGDADDVAVAARALSNPGDLKLAARIETLRPMLSMVERYRSGNRKDDAEALVNFLARVKWDFQGVSEEQEEAFYRLLLRGDGQILGQNQTLWRKAPFALVAGNANARFWLPSTEWMVKFTGDASVEQALEGAVEAEALRVAELTSGRVTEQIVPGGLASKNSVLWWRESTPGGKLTFEIEAPRAGNFELIAAMLYDRGNGIVQFELNGAKIGDPVDGYRKDLSASGPASMGVHPFQQGKNLLTLKMAGTNPAAEPLYVFGIDYLKIAPENQKGQAAAVDRVARAKGEIVRMFTGWFAPETAEATRRTAVALANKTALRRNPAVRTALAAYVEREPLPPLRESIQNILNSDDAVYGRQLRKLIEAEGGATSVDELIKDALLFRDQVFVEMNRENAEDNRACLSCHGVPGRVPPLYLDPPDAAGYIAPAQLLANYRRMQQRVDLNNVERSKFLTKPLNLQTGQEDGHQGGVRYKSTDPGYQIIRDWVLNQVKLQAPRAR